MKIFDILSKDAIIPNLSSKTKEEVLKELAEPILNQDRSINKEEFIRVLYEREKLGSTGVGDGIAIPHGKLKTVKRLMASFGRSLDGIDFDSMDGEPVHLFFLLVAPENSAGMHLKALAKISRLLKEEGFRKRLMEAESREDIYRIIAERDEET